MSAIRRRLLFLACLLPFVLPAWTGCRTDPGGRPGDGRATFGDPYEVVLGFSSVLADTPPALVGDTLVALVAYPGGCEDHDFTLAFDAHADTTRFRLVHDAGGDACEERVSEELRLAVPADALASPTLLLLNPQDPVPFVLRWGGE